MKNTFGSDLSLTIFGESHGRAVGAVLDGMAAGVPVDEAFLAACMDKRRARGDGLSTPRVEGDAVQFLSGVGNGRTTGTAIALMIENQNTRSGDYAKTADLLRPGHADYTAYAKYHGYQDARGGGHFSGRVTAALVAGGALVLGALNRAGIEIVTHIGRCAGISDAPFALDDPAALAAQAETLLNKSEGFALLDGSVEEPMKAAIRAAGAEAAMQCEQNTLNKLCNGITTINDSIKALDAVHQKAEALDGQEQANVYAHEVVPAMDALRAAVDAMEEIVAADYWPVPTYDDILFYV